MKFLLTMVVERGGNRRQIDPRQTKISTAVTDNLIKPSNNFTRNYFNLHTHTHTDMYKSIPYI